MSEKNSVVTLQAIIAKLNNFWAQKGCAIINPLDIEVGAGTFHWATTLKSLGPEPWAAAYPQACRRPTDGRYGENPNRLQHYYQYQVVMKPNPENLQQMYLESLEELGIDLKNNDIRFVEDNWESPTLGAWGLGWEVWINGMEVTQFTYFQQVAGLPCKPVTGEITYGIERIAMYIQEKDNFFDLIYAESINGPITYRDIYLENEKQMSAYNFEHANVEELKNEFDRLEKRSQELCKLELPLPAYELMLKSSHTFNILDARGAISSTERQAYILKIRGLTFMCAEKYLAHREKMGFPLMKKNR